MKAVKPNPKFVAPRISAPIMISECERRTVMKFFIDTANVDEIRKANDMGVIAGVTTNPA